MEKLTIGTPLVEASALIWIAEKQGFFNENHLDVSIRIYETGKFAVEDMINNKIDLGLSAVFVIGNKVSENPDLRILGVLTVSDIQAFLLRKEKNIRTINDLKGKKIGVTPNTSAEYALETVLYFNQISLKNVKIVNDIPSKLNERFISGELDAILMWEPNIYRTLSKIGDNGFILNDINMPLIYQTLSGKKANLEEKKEAVERFVKALDQAEKFLNSNPEQSKLIIKSRISSTSEYIEYVWSKHQFNLSLPQNFLILLENQLKWSNLKKNPSIKKIPHLLNYFDFSFLESVDRKKIMIIR
ncbi:MAG TPA: hypothetical protein DHW82_02810 [Spirochaetia bacterium]|nr:hypothetical protein [Spirochaetia bacterium]